LLGMTLGIKEKVGGDRWRTRSQNYNKKSGYH
jgi:hypothetical protein